MLHACVERYPDEPAGYIHLAHAYLEGNQRDEAFRWALKAYSRFKDDANVAAELFRLSTVAGAELHPEARAAFREFMAGGRFEQTGHMRPYSLDQVVELYRRRHQLSLQLESFYRAGRMSSMFLCRLQDSTLFRSHTVATRTGQLRYAAAGDQPYGADWLKSNNPRGVVLDYSAILTLWSWFGEEWVGVLRRSFDRAWVPTRLRHLLDWEQERLSLSGQRSRHEAPVRIRDLVNRPGSRVRVEPAEETSEGEDRVGVVTEVASSVERGVPHLNEHAVDDLPRAPLTVGLRVLADAMHRAGRISRGTHDRLVADSHPVSDDELAAGRAVTPGGSIVANVSTLVEIVLADALEAFHGYFGEIIISEPAWRDLQAEIAVYEEDREMADQLRRLRRSLGQAVDTGFVQPRSAPPDLRSLSVRVQDDDAAATDEGNVKEEGTSHKDPRWSLLLEYLDDLLAIAHMEQCPIWTDDRRTSKLYLDGRDVPYIFGSDQFAEWRRCQERNDDEWFDRYGDLLEWGYLGLPIHPGYIIWLLGQGISPDEGRFARSLLLYR
ncbi:MAG: hypothetical protein M3P51_11380, partial [Chloroflexota bacterium]|nr:hypothetical protein [Chloroflexota bacterium]